MATVSGRLNPNAPVYVPVVYREVDDFSPEWWALVKSSSWFRDYWLSVCNVEDESLEAEFEEMVMLAEQEKSANDWSSPENDRLAQTNSFHGLKVDVKTVLKDIITPKFPKERSPKSPTGPAKYRTKANQYVSPKSAPRRIHQPR